MSKQKPLYLILLSALLAGNAYSADDVHEVILEFMQRAFDAVGSHDPDDLRALQLAEGTSISFRPHPSGTPGELLMRMSSNEALLAGEADSTDEYLERWTGDPTVMIHGPIAVVWGEYEFLVNGEFSHCGVDSIDLVKVDGDWKIANWMWTVEKDDCGGVDENSE